MSAEAENYWTEFTGELMRNRLSEIRTKQITTTHPFPLDRLKEELLKVQPRQIFNIEYSTKVPFLAMWEYSEEGCVYYCHAWADKEPVFETWGDFYAKYSIVGGIENLCFPD